MNIYVARQPIFDRSGETIAYELLYRDNEQNFYSNSLSDSVSTSILLLNSYLSLGMTLLTDNKKGFINFGPSLILDDIPKLLSKERVVIELLESVKPEHQLIRKLKELKSLGYIIALDDYVMSYPYEELLELCDIIKVDFIGNTDMELRHILKRLQPLNKILLAEKIETKEQFDWAKRNGFEFFQGYFFSRPLMIKGKRLESTTVSFVQIMEELTQPVPDYKKITDIIETQVSLTYKLLKLVNSSFSLIDNVTSIHHCISILGIDAFEKWFTLAIIHEFGEGKSNELVKLSMIRMKFMESIGESSIFVQHIHALRIIGILSTIDALLERSMEEVMTQLPIDKTIKDTLLGKKTLYSSIYEIVQAYERGDFDTAEKIAQTIQLDFHLFPEIYLTSIRWAEEIFNHLNG
jgi:c-di-GMP-related signal transduction protein